MVTILHSAQQWQWENISQTLDSQKTPHTSPSWVSYGVPFVRILEKIDRVIRAPHCGRKPARQTISHGNTSSCKTRSMSSQPFTHWPSHSDPDPNTPIRWHWRWNVSFSRKMYTLIHPLWFTCYWISFNAWMKNNQHWFRKLLGIEWHWGNDLTISQWWSKPLTYNGV